MYYCPANVSAAGYINCPTDQAFSLFVERHAGARQTLTEYVTSGARTFTTNYYQGWGAWTKPNDGGNALAVGGLARVTGVATDAWGVREMGVGTWDMGIGVALTTGSLYFVYE